MRQEEFNALMPYISADLVAEVSKRQGISNEEAIKKVYNSKLYSLLEQEDTKIWHYSTLMLYSLLEQEEKTGIIEFPDV